MVQDLAERLDISESFAKEENYTQYKGFVIETLTILAESTQQLEFYDKPKYEVWTSHLENCIYSL